jgi:hypothetical protein
MGRGSRPYGSPETGSWRWGVTLNPRFSGRSSYLNALIDAGFCLDGAFEPPAPVPTQLVLVCRKA